MQLLKNRTLKVGGMSCVGCEATITDRISKLNGFISVDAAYETGKVHVIYDLMIVELKDIEGKLNDLGYSVDRGFLYRVRDGFLHFIEENERDTFRAKPVSCCSDPTENLVKAGKKSLFS